MSQTFRISLVGLTPKQIELQLKSLGCRKHNGTCSCYLLEGEAIPVPDCPIPKKLSTSWIKTHQPQKPIKICNNC